MCSRTISQIATGFGGAARGAAGSSACQPSDRAARRDAWHHLSFVGAPREEIAATARLLDGALPHLGARSLALYDRLRDEVDQADGRAQLVWLDGLALVGDTGSMARRRPPAGPASLEHPVRDVELTVSSDADAPARRFRIAAVTALALALAVLAVVFGGVLQRAPSRSHGRGSVAVSIGPNVLIGPDALAAAFRESMRCQTLTFASGDSSYLRATPDRTGDCRQHSPGRPIIYREVGREFRVVLDSTDYSCPVRSLPAVVQTDLGVCPRDGYQYR